MHQRERRLSNLSECSESDALVEATVNAKGASLGEYGAVARGGELPAAEHAEFGGFVTPRAGDLGASRDSRGAAPLSFRNPI